MVERSTNERPSTVLGACLACDDFDRAERELLAVPGAELEPEWWRRLQDLTHADTAALLDEAADGGRPPRAVSARHEPEPELEPPLPAMEAREWTFAERRALSADASTLPAPYLNDGQSYSCHHRPQTAACGTTNDGASLLRLPSALVCPLCVHLMVWDHRHHTWFGREHARPIDARCRTLATTTTTTTTTRRNVIVLQIIYGEETHIEPGDEVRHGSTGDPAEQCEALVCRCGVCVRYRPRHLDIPLAEVPRKGVASPTTDVRQLMTGDDRRRRTCLTKQVWYAPHKQGARPMARHPRPPQFEKKGVRADYPPVLMSTQPCATSCARALIHLTPSPQNHAVPTYVHARDENVFYT